jgi:hypothetical protein
MLTFNDTRNSLVATKPHVGKVHLVLGDTSISISGARTLGAGELWVIPTDKTQSYIQVTSEHTITVLP